MACIYVYGIIHYFVLIFAFFHGKTISKFSVHCGCQLSISTGEMAHWLTTEDTL